LQLLLGLGALLLVVLLTFSSSTVKDSAVAQAGWAALSRGESILRNDLPPSLDRRPTGKGRQRPPVYVDPDEAKELYQPHSAQGVDTTSSVALSSSDYSLAHFLADRLEQPGISKPDKLWLTIADANYCREVLNHLARFLGRLNAKALGEEQPASRRIKGPQPHDLLVLCLDEGCVDYCAGKGWLAYGGYVREPFPTAGEKGMGQAQWIKSRSGRSALAATGC
jgi:hypothetical protein